MKSNGLIVLFSLAVMLLAACEGHEDDWVPLSDDERENELMIFMEEYKDAWESAIDAGTFSPAEPFFIPNSQVYHMERRQQQQISGNRQSERFLYAEDIEIKQNQDGDYQISWIEFIETTGTEEEEHSRARRYTISDRGEGDFRIIAVERETDIE
ncbi:TcaA NTF2-like domain-containing protein [Salisediminibacterium selenitireducens]|uniref:TcaA protein NTF2-like domain-containing protein n=1 Tax=Bacillus selenitireducens (strain ATCC 700615 / DSM 15326 / MLS10) TaxID=439292 RepID=D6XUV7_BACIE|nr:hypothetical protein [Salisediminibacterium selenitireducens]ADH99593.1 hypothetical protein Bsel_2089 [[Bacillus] selenitireducens MLS10]